jgi:hypothetical protein
MMDEGEATEGEDSEIVASPQKIVKNSIFW